MMDLVWRMGMPVELETAAGKWCLVRYNLEGGFCGPLSCMIGFDIKGGFGFPDRGEIGFVALFETEELARAAVEAGPWRDVPVRLSDLHFSVEEYDYHCGKSTVIYSGGEYMRAVLARTLKRGLVASLPYPDRYKIDLKARATWQR